MKSSSTFELNSYLPSPFKLVENNFRKDIENTLDSILSPRRKINLELSKVFACADSKNYSECSFLLKRNFLGLARFFKGRILPKVLFPVFNEYLSFRGSRRGFEILFNACFPGSRIEIKERSLPRAGISLGESTLNSNSCIAEGAAELTSVCFQFPFLKEMVDQEILKELQEFLKDEISDGLQFYFEFQKSVEEFKNLESPQFFTIGERL